MQEQDNNIVDLTKQTYINKANIETLQVDITSIKNKIELYQCLIIDYKAILYLALIYIPIRIKYKHCEFWRN